MKGLVINRGASEIVINVSTVKYTGTTSVEFAGTVLNKISADDIASLEAAIAAYVPSGSGGSYDEGYADGEAAMESAIESSQASVAGQYKSKLASEDATIAAADATDIDGQGTIFSESYSYLKTSAEMQANYNSGYTAGETAGYTSGYSAGETAGEAAGKAAIATSQQPIASDYKSLLSGVDQTIAAADPTTLAGQLSIFNESYQYLSTGGSEWHCDDPLCFELAQGSTSSTVTIDTNVIRGCEISLDKAIWTSIVPDATWRGTINTTSPKLYVRSKIISHNYYYGTSVVFSGSGGKVNLSGDLRSLCELNKGEMITAHELAYLFLNNTCIVDASQLKTHSNLTSNCYMNMFAGCTSLTTAPTLQSTTMAYECYKEMFRNCTSLTTAPALPATTLAYGCYKQMFRNCTSLTTAPALPVINIDSNNTAGCYYGMFMDCTSLVTAPALPATTLSTACYKEMFFGCTSLTIAPALPATKSQPQCYESMFRNCTSLTTAPTLPSTTLAYECYRSMFLGCTNLSSITLGATTWSTSSTFEWVSGVSATGTFTKPSGTSIPTGTSGIPSGWTVIDV